jgi:ribonuclease HI
MWWTDGSRSDDGRVGTAAVCKHRDKWRSRRCYLGIAQMVVFDAELWAIGLALEETIKKTETQQRHGVNTVAVFSNSQAAIRQTAHLEPGRGQRLATRITRRAQALLAHGINPAIHWVPGHSGIPGNEEADRQENIARVASGDTEMKRPYTSASNMARRISEGRSLSKAEWEADKCSKHFGYRLRGKAGAKRSIPITSAKSRPARFYRLKSGHGPTGVYLKRFGHREDVKCWWSGTRGRAAAPMREHLFRRCSR